MKTLAECYYGNTRDNVRAIYNTLCIGDNFRPYIRQFSTIYTTIFDHIYDNFRPHIRQFSTKIFVHISKPDCLSPLIFLSSTNEWWGKNYKKITEKKLRKNLKITALVTAYIIPSQWKPQDFINSN